MRVRKAYVWLMLTLLLLQGCGRSSAPTTSPAPPDSALTPAIPDTLPVSAPVAREPEPAPEPELAGGLGVMVENSPGARPQAGLNMADLVYELETEYGITRFLSLYYTKEAAKIGPVRSARMAFYEIAKAYGLPYGHAGGNPDVLDVLARDWEMPDMDEIYTCGDCFWRSDDREPPHNLYTSTARMGAVTAERGVTPLPLQRYPIGHLTGGRPATHISYSWGAQTQDVAWRWDGERYVRSQSGEVHMLEDGEPITTENLVVFWTRYVWVHKGEWQHDVTITGSGPGFLLRGGQVYAITWSKEGPAEHYQFALPDGELALLAPGRAWIAVIASDNFLQIDE